MKIDASSWRPDDEVSQVWGDELVIGKVIQLTRAGKPFLMVQVTGGNAKCGHRSWPNDGWVLGVGFALVRCVQCDQDFRTKGRDTFCPACSRDDRLPSTQPAPEEPVAAPRLGIHEAAQPEERLIAGVMMPALQRCARCGDVLKTFRPTNAVPGGAFYPVGSLVERGRTWQAMKLTAATASCMAGKRS